MIQSTMLKKMSAMWRPSRHVAYWPSAGPAQLGASTNDYPTFTDVQIVQWYCSVSTATLDGSIAIQLRVNGAPLVNDLSFSLDGATTSQWTTVPEGNRTTILNGQYITGHVFGLGATNATDLVVAAVVEEV